jgi:hypothetical protein
VEMDAVILGAVDLSKKGLRSESFTIKEPIILAYFKISLSRENQ